MIGALGTVTEGLIKGLEELKLSGWMENHPTTALLRSAKILRRVLETCCRSNSRRRPLANADMKNSEGVNNNKVNAAK